MPASCCAPRPKLPCCSPARPRKSASIPTSWKSGSPRGSAAADARRRARWRARASVELPHVLTNTGNIVSGYVFDLDVIAGSFAPQAPHIVHDRNDNGVEDDGDVRIPLQARRSRWNPAKPPACWQSPPCPTKRRTDRLPCCACRPDRKRAACSPARTISSSCEGAAFMLHKTADTNRAQGGDVIDYTLDATNNGNADAQGTDTGKDLDGATGALRIDGAAARAVLLHDRIPAHTRLVSGSLETAIAGARRLWHAPGDAPFSYRSSEVANADEVAIALPAVQPNQSLRMRFGARGRRPCRPRRQRRRAELPRRRLARRRARASEQYRARDDRRSRGRGPDAGKDARRQFPRRPGAGIHAESPRDEPAQRRPDHRRRHAA